MFSIWMDDNTEAIFAPPIRHYVELLLDRFIPLFDDAEGEQARATEEALRAYERAWGEDYEGAVEAAYDYGIGHAIMFMEMRSVFVATGVAGLFHLFEKLLYRQLNHELRRVGAVHSKTGAPYSVTRWDQAREMIQELRHSPNGPLLLNAFSSPDLDELRLVANAVKHGEGRSLDELKAANAAVVDPSRIDRDFTVGERSALGVRIAIHREDIERYRDAVISYWKVRGNFTAEPVTPPSTA